MKTNVKKIGMQLKERSRDACRTSSGYTLTFEKTKMANQVCVCVCVNIIWQRHHNYKNGSMNQYTAREDRGVCKHFEYLELLTLFAMFGGPECYSKLIVHT